MTINFADYRWSFQEEHRPTGQKNRYIEYVISLLPGNCKLANANMAFSFTPSLLMLYIGRGCSQSVDMGACLPAS